MIRLLTILVILAGVVLAPQSGYGAYYSANTTSDLHDAIVGDGICGDPANPDSGCSLRAALEESDATGSADTVVLFASLGPYRLTLGELPLSEDSTVLTGIGLPIVDGVNNPRRSDILHITGSHCQVRGLLLQRARRHAVYIASDSNTVGGTLPGERNVFVACGIDDSLSYAVFISGPAAYGNAVAGNIIGMRPDGLTAHANLNGIGITNQAHHNTIGPRNLISGNRGDGVVIDYAANNTVSGNNIGPDLSGMQGPGNGRDGIRIASGATANRIGGYTLTERNLISANSSDGVRLTGAETEDNLLVGNVIGLDIGGIILFGNSAAGVVIDSGAARNRIGDGQPGGTNVISGNYGDGIRVLGAATTGNTIKGNFIGVDTSGFRSSGNGQRSGHGIYLGPGVNETYIGAPDSGHGNVISGNYGAGVFLDAAHDNVIQGNMIGVSIGSQSSSPNASGVVLRHGSSRNLIGGPDPGEGNVLSGNRGEPFPLGAGVALYDPGTDHNRIVGNRIGSDLLASRPLRNGSAGVLIGNGARYNIVGGVTPAERNIISGNGAGSSIVTIGSGVHIFGDGTDFNQIVGNFIGVGLDTTIAIGNLGNGVGVYDGAQQNVIGGDTPDAGNLIAANAMHGVYFSGSSTRSNPARFNRIYFNDSLGIALRYGAQDSIVPPVLELSGPSTVSGSHARPGAAVDLYLAVPDPSEAGEGEYVIASAEADVAGNFAIDIAPLPAGSRLTAIQTDSVGNTSEFSQNLQTGLVTDVEDGDVLPARFSLGQNYPNPFNPATHIRFALPSRSHCRLQIFNIVGECVRTLVSADLPAGEHTVIWDGKTTDGHQLASGLYLYRLESAGRIATRKMLLLK